MRLNGKKKHPISKPTFFWFLFLPGNQKVCLNACSPRYYLRVSKAHIHQLLPQLLSTAATIRPGSIFRWSLAEHLVELRTSWKTVVKWPSANGTPGDSGGNRTKDGKETTGKWNHQHLENVFCGVFLRFLHLIICSLFFFWLFRSMVGLKSSKVVTSSFGED